MAAATLITGATGLIGSWTVRQWTGPPPVAVGRAQVDLRDAAATAALLDQVRPDAVVHLAWSASGTPGYRHSDDNARWLDATLDLSRQCRHRGVPLYCTGTVVDDTPDPQDAYTRAKRDLREALDGDIATGSVTWLRPHYVFDPAAGRPVLVAQALAARAAGEPVVLSAPTSEHDFVHAADVGAAVAHAVRHGLRGVVEIGSGRTRPVRRLVEALEVPWTVTGEAPAASTPPAQIAMLTATGWSASRTEEFFADA